MNFKQSLIVAAVFNSFCMGTAFAADSAILTVTGTIKPAACSPSFPGGSVINLGDNIKLKETGVTIVQEVPKNIFRITCPSAMKVAFSVGDNKPGIAQSVINHNMGFRFPMFGLGESGGKKNGGIVLVVRGFANESTSVGMLESEAGTPDTWSRVSYGSTPIKAGQFYTLSVNQNDVMPGAYVAHTYSQDVRPYIASKSDLDLSSEVKLDGSLTYTLKYL